MRLEQGLPVKERMLEGEGNAEKQISIKRSASLRFCFVLTC